MNEPWLNPNISISIQLFFYLLLRRIRLSISRWQQPSEIVVKATVNMWAVYSVIGSVHGTVFVGGTETSDRNMLTRRIAMRALALDRPLFAQRPRT